MGSRNRLIGENAISPEARAIGARCVAFLVTDVEFEWPRYPRYGFFYWYLATGLLAFVAPLIAMVVGRGDYGLMLSAVGTPALACVWISHKLRLRKQLRAYWNTGDKDVWPFLRKADYDRALATCSSAV